MLWITESCCRSHMVPYRNGICLSCFILSARIHQQCYHNGAALAPLEMNFKLRWS
ncbi:hypothetical protein ERO13_A02G044703v2 [Gossypium hirsutum]|uniref:Uncharacterized protein n=2 Tax=Gossypium TaxID=3633 RepID=A0A5J5WMJ5_GOSBA|nr:hypothetical protein ES319_A02G049300v1 [Gossypium barbadense]KAB2092716.1 hypothetical protein ES319_A02G049300v1 [Gossypium barbadense]KAG4210394.1 hypothetical protein ERO13_A02G044703v2 [Gossypium hirsutum]TYJ45388.1 hypothetical protein E1A91_A02G051900v1 [Gossypium mustelinum]TYJ45389.1 hypothetical protein E1A91_A02G051900v1 [Gossypium mustelinum]